MPDVSIMTMIKERRRQRFKIRSWKHLNQACSSLLVPLMIGVFTVVTTVLQMNLAKQQRQQDIQIAKENREKDERIEDRRRAVEDKTEENQEMNTVLATYLQHMAELMLSKNFTLADKMMSTVVRAKTLTTLGQLDGKRKGHIVRFLYEAHVISVEQPSIDLTDADLSNVDLRDYRLTNASFMKCKLFNGSFSGTNLQNVNFINAELSDVSFDYSRMINVSFAEAILVNSSFIHADLTTVDFQSANVTNAKFTGATALSSIWFNVKGNNTNFNRAFIAPANFSRCILFKARFVETRFHELLMNDATLYETNFTDASIPTANFARSQMVRSIFDRSTIDSASFYGSDLMATTWLNTRVEDVDFSKANLYLASITDDQIRRAMRTFDIILPDGSKGFDTNLLKNGDAEGVNGQCEITPWHVNFITAQERKHILSDIFGRCYFTRSSMAKQGKMSQRVQVPNEYTEWIRANMSLIRIIGDCRGDGTFMMHIKQFNGNNNLSLVNNTHSMRADEAKVFLPMHTATTQIELEIVITKSSSLVDESENYFEDYLWESEEIDSCDNLKLAIWHRNYTR